MLWSVRGFDYCTASRTCLNSPSGLWKWSLVVRSGIHVCRECGSGHGVLAVCKEHEDTLGRVKNSQEKQGACGSQDKRFVLLSAARLDLGL